jgi:predicted phage terminase large subunit-like protein
MPLYGVSVSHASSAADWWEIENSQGAMMTAGVGGAVTGKGADILIVDDPIKNAEEARSTTIREKIWDWWGSTFYTRGEPNCGYLVIQTRWNEDDLTGRLLALAKEDGMAWEHVNLPAIAEEDEHIELDGGLTYDRKRGEALWPERYPLPVLADRKSKLGSYWFAALFQQRPAPEEGDRFKRQWFRYWSYIANETVYQLGTDKKVPVDACWTFGTMDLAASEKSTADYTVIGIWAVTPDNDLLLLDIIRAQVSAAEHDALIESVFAQHALSFLGIESVQYQLSLVQRMTRKGYPIRKLKADRDKVSRSLVASARYEIGAMYHKANATWLDTYEDELLHFPNAKHDDQVDAAGYAAIALIPDSDNERAPIPVTFLAGKLH